MARRFHGRYAHNFTLFRPSLIISSAIYIQGSDSKPMNSSSTILSGTASKELAPGPYFINAAGHVYEAWRLFSDMQGAFTESAIANGDGSYSVLPAGTVGQLRGDHLADDDRSRIDQVLNGRRSRISRRVQPVPSSVSVRCSQALDI